MSRTQGQKSELITVANPSNNLEEIVVDVTYIWWTEDGDRDNPPCGDLKIVTYHSVAPLPDWFNTDLIYNVLNERDVTSF